MENVAHATTIVCVRRGKKLAMAGDGQVTLGNTVMKKKAVKLRRLGNGRILAGFAGSAADAFTLFEKFEEKLEQYRGNLLRAAVELAKDWRMDKMLRRLEALLLIADEEKTLVVGGSGDVIEPDDAIAAIGSGGAYALAAGKALLAETDLPVKIIAEKALVIASEICIYTNEEITVEEL